MQVASERLMGDKQFAVLVRIDASARIAAERCGNNNQLGLTETYLDSCAVLRDHRVVLAAPRESRPMADTSACRANLSALAEVHTLSDVLSCSALDRAGRCAPASSCYQQSMGWLTRTKYAVFTNRTVCRTRLLVMFTHAQCTISAREAVRRFVSKDVIALDIPRESPACDACSSCMRIIAPPITGNVLH